MKVPNFVKSNADRRSVVVDGKDRIVYDGDTITAGGTPIRVYGIDAPEKDKLVPGHGQVYNLAEDRYTDMLVDFIKNRGYNREEFIKKGPHGRNISRLKTEAGRDLVYDALSQGLIEPGPYSMGEDPMLEVSYSIGLINQVLQGTKNLPKDRQAELLLNTLSAQHYDFLDNDLYERANKAYYSGATGDDIGFLRNTWEALQTWWYQTSGAFSGFEASVGKATGIDALEEHGKKGLDYSADKAQDNIDPNTVLSLQQVKDWDDVVKFGTNNLIIQGIDYGILFGGATIGTAFGGPVGGTIGGLIGLGYTYIKNSGDVAAEEYETYGDISGNKALLIGAIISGLDVLTGFAGKSALTAEEVLTAGGKKKMIEAIVKHNNVTEEVAEKMLVNEFKKNMKNIGVQMTLAASDIVVNKQVVGKIFKSAAAKLGTEVGTEMVQELTQYVSIHGLPETAEEWKEFKWRMADTAAAAGIVSGTHVTAGSLADRAAYNEFREHFDELDNVKLSFDQQYLADLVDSPDIKHNTSILEATAQWQLHEAERPMVERIGNREKSRWFGYSYIPRGARRLITGKTIPFFQNSAQNALSDIRYTPDGKIIPQTAVLEHIFGVRNALPGTSMFKEGAQRIGLMSITAPWMTNPDTYFNVSADHFKQLLNNAHANDFNPQWISQQTPEDIQILKRTLTDLAEVAKQEYEYANNAAKRGGYELSEHDEKDLKDFKRYFDTRYPDFDKIRNNSSKFVDELVGKKITNPDSLLHNKKLTRNMAQDLVDRALKGNSKELMNVLSSIDRSGLQDFYDNDAFSRVVNNASHSISSNVKREYLGTDYRVIDNIINSLVDDGYIDLQRAADLAADMYDIIAKDSGTWQRLPQFVRNLQYGAMTLTNYGQLDRVIFSQAGEYAISGIGATDGSDFDAFHNLKADKKFIKDMAEITYGFAEGYVAALRKVGSKLTRHVNIDKEPSKTKTAVDEFFLGESARDRDVDYESLGYTTHEVIAQQQLNAKYLPKFIANANEIYFTLNGLIPWTDVVRKIRMRAWSPTVADISVNLHNADISNPKSMTGYQFKQYERLRYQGMTDDDIQFMIDLHTKNADIFATEEGQERYMKIFNTAAPKFIDEMAVRVEPGSRPAILEDETFALPTQYLTFITHFTNKTLPRIYNTYGFYGTQKIAFSTFSALAFAFLSAGVAQWLKDYIKYGELNPYLKEDYGWFLRALDYSSAAGVVPDILKRFGIAEAYDIKRKSGIDELIGPTGSHVKHLVGDAYENFRDDDWSGLMHDFIKRQVPFGDLYEDRRKRNAQAQDK